MEASEPEEKDAHGSKLVTKHNLIDIGVLCGDVFKLNDKVCFCQLRESRGCIEMHAVCLEPSLQ